MKNFFYFTVKALFILKSGGLMADLINGGGMGGGGGGKSKNYVFKVSVKKRI